MPKVLNRHHFTYKTMPAEAVYIGRGTAYGNRFHIGVDGDRDDVCDAYIEEKSKDADFITMVKRNLKGKDLVCSCAPLRCHGDWLLEVANE